MSSQEKRKSCRWRHEEEIVSANRAECFINTKKHFEIQQSEFTIQSVFSSVYEWNHLKSLGGNDTILCGYLQKGHDLSALETFESFVFFYFAINNLPYGKDGKSFLAIFFLHKSQKHKLSFRWNSVKIY